MRDRHRVPFRIAAALLAPVAAVTGGCGTSREAQLESVARDWCMTIRASQVIPVYPLTQDVQPGDVYLVQTTVDRQQEVYRKKGFLPLDNHVARLQPTGYAPFYSHSFFVNDTNTTNMPARWGYTNHGAATWAPAPGAAFPTYSFSVRRGAGLNLAVPVSGVPVALSLLGTQAAEGSVSIKEARTMGIDTLSAFRDLGDWAEQNSDFLKPYGPKQGTSTPRNFLRVVTRVYSTGSLTVALSDARSAAGGADAGLTRPVELLTPDVPRDHAGAPRQTLEDYRGRLSALNAMLAEGRGAVKTPGGSLRVTAASSRFISMQEDFNPPLIIGYLAFDAPILAEGRIGAPVPTHAQIEPDARAAEFRPEEVVRALYPDGIDNAAYATLVSRGNDEPAAGSAAAALDALARHVPARYMKYEFAGEDKALTRIELARKSTKYTAFKAYRGAARSSVEALERALRHESVTLRVGQSSTSVSKDSREWSRLSGDLTEYRRFLDDAAIRREHEAASARAGREYLRLIVADAGAR